MPRLLDNDLENLIEARIIDKETAEKIKAYYTQTNTDSQGRLNLLLGILGGLLAGLGIILLVAHNWDQLSRPVKTFFAILPLVIGQSLCVYTFFRKKGSIVWQEVSGILLLLGVGASISLISQVYHIEGTTEDLLFLWILLTIPIVYIMPSQGAGLLVLVLATWQAILVGYEFRSHNTPWLYVVTLAALIPFYLRHYQKGTANNFFPFFNWALAISALLCLATFSHNTNRSYGGTFFAYLSMLCLYYAYSYNDLFKGRSFWINPFRILGFTGILLILFIWSFESAFEDLAGKGFRDFSGSPEFYMGIGFALAALFFTRKNQLYGSWVNTDAIGLSFIPFLFLQLPRISPKAGMLIDNLWILVLSLFLIGTGTRKNHLGILNLGLIVILILATCRFFDEEIPYMWRGIFFLTAGLSFFLANYLMIRNRKLHKKTT